MTICIAAFASGSKAIAMMADKAITYGDNLGGPQMQADSDVQKIIPIGKYGWKALIAGSGAVADEVLRRGLAELSNKPQIAESASAMMECLGKAYEKAREHAVMTHVLGPRLLTKELYIARPSALTPLPDDYFLRLSQEVTKFDEEWSCSLLVCGFDSRGRPHIFSVNPPGIPRSCNSEGHGVIGIGTETAIGRLLWSHVCKKDTLEEVLYGILDAKAHSELIQGVGFAWDAEIMVRGRTIRVPRNINHLLDKVFDENNRSPFTKRKMPNNWKTKLRKFAADVLKQ